MITEEIRDYFTSVINQTDPDLRFDGFIFDNENTGHTVIDRTYKLVIGSSSISRIDSSYLSTVAVEVWIYKSSGYDRVNDFHDIHCKGTEIAARAIDQTTITQTGFIKSIISDSINPEPLDDNDNAIRLRLQFSVSVYFSIDS